MKMTEAELDAIKKQVESKSYTGIDHELIKDLLAHIEALEIEIKELSVDNWKLLEEIVL